MIILIIISLTRRGNSISQIPNEDLSDLGFSYKANMRDFLNTRAQTHTHTWLVLHHSSRLYKCRKSACIMETKQEMDPEIAGHSQECCSLSDANLHLTPLSFAPTHTHTQTENLAFQTSVPISHLDSERTCHLQLMVCRPTRRGTSFINPLNYESRSEGMQHISKILYG